MKSRSFPPVSAPDARVLILGSLPGQASLRQQHYYAHPGNAFWRIMGEIAGASPQLPYAQRLLKLTEHKIALWDVCAAAIRPGSLDADIRQEEPNDFGTFLKAHPRIALILFNGNPAAKIYARRVLAGLPPDAQNIPRTILPSTSPAHAGMPFAQKLAHWRAALDVIAVGQNA